MFWGMGLREAKYDVSDCLCYSFVPVVLYVLSNIWFFSALMEFYRMEIASLDMLWLLQCYLLSWRWVFTTARRTRIIRMTA